MFQGKAQRSASTLGRTDTSTLNAVAEHKWLQAKQYLWSVLLITSGSANNAVKTFIGKQPEDGAGHGQLAWKALTEEYNGRTKETRRACHEKLVNTKMEPGQDPDDLFLVFDECFDLLEEMGQTLHDVRYDDIILQGLPPEYERVQTASFERRNFRLDDIRRMIHTTYVNNRSRSVNAKPVAGRGKALQVVGYQQGCPVQLLQMIRIRHAGLRHPKQGALTWAESRGSATPAKATLASPRKSRITRREERGRY